MKRTQILRLISVRTVLLVLYASSLAAAATPALVLNNALPNEATTGESDWLVDLIEQLLGLTVAEFLNLIYTSLAGIQTLIEMGALELQEILVHLHPEAQERVEEIISVALKDAQDSIQPVLDQLDEIMPIISSGSESKDLITDLIEAILGVTLEELLTNITQVMLHVYNLILTCILDLNAVANDVSEEPAEMLRSVVEEHFVHGLEQFISPLLDMLEQLFPDYYQ